MPFQKEGEWETVFEAGNLLTGLVGKVVGMVTKALDIFNVQKRVVEFGRFTEIKTYVYPTLYDSTDPNPDNWLEIPGFRGKGTVQSKIKSGQLTQGVEHRVCVVGSHVCSGAF